MHRTVAVELNGILRQVPAEYHRTGHLAGRMLTARVFHATSPFGECPVPVAMPLHRPTERTDPRLIVVDDQITRWVMGFKVQHGQRAYRITDFYPL
ncbi:hypothetical protein M8Z33_41860 [Streptomyces sp. ZAF1911]|uniref:hypothetical protein n=1 Tax=Streptomyces sp. ZAF1911 TaxID=2944129 RepID=UPI00237A144F|nr:hypothetical protein [Streptomyces sp. ZAF1911]MDD9383084.1 hypothetical protein [Streptomyces sp. ZAF1911]